MEEFNEAIERVVAGLEKKNRLINPKEKKIVAFHESGHAVVAAFTSGSDAVHKISIVPRGVGALGYTLQLPTEDRFLMSKSELLGKIDVLLGGRAAEKIVFDEVSTGAQNDLARATDIAKSMITEYGMGETLGPVTYSRQASPLFPTGKNPFETKREFSEETQRLLDAEVKKILEDRMRHVETLLTDKRDILREVAERLLKKEVVEKEEFLQIVHPRKDSKRVASPPGKADGSEAPSMP